MRGSNLPLDKACLAIMIATMKSAIGRKDGDPVDISAWKMIFEELSGHLMLSLSSSLYSRKAWILFNLFIKICGKDTLKEVSLFIKHLNHNRKYLFC